MATLADGMVPEQVVSGGSLRLEDAQRRIRLVLQAAIEAAAAKEKT